MTAVAYYPKRMRTTRRSVLKGLGTAAALAALPGEARPQASAPGRAPAAMLPAKSDFDIPPGVTYLNCAYTHPLPRAAHDAARQWAEYRMQAAPDSRPLPLADIQAGFAALINARPAEIALIQCTSAGENLVVQALDIPRSGGNVVTDELHFEGALLHLEALQKQYGLDLRIVKARDWRVDARDLERAVDRNTRLVEISLVAMDNGFQHDLKAVCDLAHAAGAYVYADIAQAAGCTPMDVRAAGLDFAACSSFKWLMGDFGLGFLFAREDLLERVARRPVYGYYEASRLDSHFMPGDAPAPLPYSFALTADAAGYFETGTYAIGVAHVLAASLPYIRGLGVANIEAHRQPLLQRLQQEMPRLGFAPLTPPGTKSALVSFAVKDRDDVARRLAGARINARLGSHFLRLSPSVFNDLGDVERLLEALA